MAAPLSGAVQTNANAAAVIHAAQARRNEKDADVNEGTRHASGRCLLLSEIMVGAGGAHQGIRTNAKWIFRASGSVRGASWNCRAFAATQLVIPRRERERLKSGGHMAVSAEALVRQLTETYAIACRRARAEIEWGETAQEVLNSLRRPIKPTLLRDQPVDHQERLMWAAAGEQINKVHARALAFLTIVPERDFAAMLDWHRSVNLEPCKVFYPAVYQEFDAKLRRLADNRRLEVLKNERPDVLH
jgi:hypothetical protein